MVTTINKYLWLLLALCCTLAVSSVSAASDAEYKKLAKSWTLHADGSQEFRCIKELTIFTHAAMNSKYGETFIEYNPQYQTLKINESYTRQLNGTVVTTPANAFVEVLPKNAEDAPAYNHLKEMVVVHTGLELGATIYLDYTITSKPGYLPEIDVFEPLQKHSPVREYTLTTTVPADKKLTYTLANASVKPVVDEEAGKRTSTWTLRNIPQLATSVAVDVANGDLPYFAATTYADTKAALQFLHQQKSAPSEELKDLVAEVTKGSTCEICKMKKISAFISKKLATSAVTLSEAGYRFRPTSDVLASAYGTAIEKASLMADMLQVAGLKAEVVAGYPLHIEKGAALAAISELYVAVADKQCIFSTNSLERPQSVIFGQTPLYSLRDGSQVKVEAPHKYQLTGKQHISTVEDKWIISRQETVGPDLLPYFAENKLEKQDTISLQARHGYATLVLQDNAHGISALGYGRLNSSRKVNLLLPRLVDESYTYEVTCPANMQLRTPAGKQEVRNAAGTLVISIEKNGQQATITRSIQLNKQLYTPGEYKALRTLLTKWSDVNSRTLLFTIK